MNIEAEQGYLIIAVNTCTVDYITMAQRLARSLKSFHADAKTCLLTDRDLSCDVFDFVRILPHGNLGGYLNDWQAWFASPFRQTVKLEADMLVVSEIDHWWLLFQNRDVLISTGARNIYDQPVTTRAYRKIFDDNFLPDTYNAVTYWRLCDLARDFWHLVHMIFTNWQDFKPMIRFAPEQPDTDLVYAMAAQILGPEKVTMPFASYPRIVHMKQHAQPVTGKNWRQELVWEDCDPGLRLNTVHQWGCLHYHDKTINEQHQ